VYRIFTCVKLKSKHSVAGSVEKSGYKGAVACVFLPAQVRRFAQAKPWRKCGCASLSSKIIKGWGVGQNKKTSAYADVFFGAGGVTRTPDLLITNQLLYRLSYTSKYLIFVWSTTELYTTKRYLSITKRTQFF
jgi:hypothetical protein